MSYNGHDLIIDIIVPPAENAGRVVVTVEDDSEDGKTSLADFEFFNPAAVVRVAPDRATLLGKTTAEDGNSILVVLKDFPVLASAGGYVVRFGDVECGARNAGCGITHIRRAERDGSALLFLRIKVPAQNSRGDVIVSIERRDNPAGRLERQVSFIVTYYEPPPVITFVKWCPSCEESETATGEPCMAMGRCRDGSEPLLNLVPLSGGGVLTVYIRNPPDISEPEISLSLGDSDYADFSKYAVRTRGMVALEFTVPLLDSPQGSELRLTIAPQSGVCISPCEASHPFSFFDDSVSLTCLEGCESAANANQEVLVAITNFPVSDDLSVLDQVFAQFGDVEAISIEKEQDHSNCTGDVRCFRLVAPTCDQCSFDRGSRTVVLAVSLKADPSRGAQTDFTYWSAPSVESAQMDSIGSKIMVMFNQFTDQAGMLNTDENCTRILEPETLSMLSADASARCVWNARDSLVLFLGDGGNHSPCAEELHRRHAQASQKFVEIRERNLRFYLC